MQRKWCMIQSIAVSYICLSGPMDGWLAMLAVVTGTNKDAESQSTPSLSVENGLPIF